MSVNQHIVAYFILLIIFLSAAVEKLAAYNVGCLVTTDANGKESPCHVKELLHWKPSEVFVKFFAPYSPGNLSGVISERDYVMKIALLGKTVSTTHNSYLRLFSCSSVC